MLRWAPIFLIMAAVAPAAGVSVFFVLYTYGMP